MSKAPTVSVIIPTFNRADLLKRAIDSVLKQTYGDYEILIISDGSKDHTDQVVSSYKDSRIRYYKKFESKGAAAARNVGLKHAKGNFIAFLDDDDEWVENKLEIQLPVIKKSASDIGLIYAWMEYYKKGKLIQVYSPKLRGNVFKEMLDKQAIGGCPTIIIKKEVIDKIGLFDESLPRGNDGDYWRRISKIYHVEFIPQVLAKIHTDNEDRVSVNTVDSIKNAIFAMEKRLEDYEKDFNFYPEKKANVLSNIGLYYLRLGKYKAGTKNLLYSIRLLGVKSIKFKFILNKTKKIIKYSIEGLFNARKPGIRK